jgi:hypothetical protein
MSVQRIEIDFIELRGSAFAGWNRQKTLLALVREGLAEAVFIAAGELQALPTEILRKKTIVLTPFLPGKAPTLLNKRRSLRRFSN